MALYVFDIKPVSGNYGTLITPVQKLDWPRLETLDGETYDGGFGRKWTLVLFAGDDCAELCRSNLFYMRQLRTLLGRDTLRLQNVLISAQPLSAEMQIYLQEFPNLKVVQDYRDPALFRQFDLPGMGAVGSAPKMYLVDPGPESDDALSGRDRSGSCPRGHQKVAEVIADWLSLVSSRD